MSERPVSEQHGLARFKLWGRVALGGAIVLAALLAWRHRATFDPLAIAGAVAVYPLAPLVFPALHVVASLLFLPRTIFAVAAGVVFGLFWGLVWATLGSVVGAVAGFLVARYVNAGLVDLETMPHLGPILRRAEAGGWRSVMALRLIPIVPHSLGNYALGLTRLPLGAYAWGSLLGQLPMTFASVELGAAGGRLWAGSANWFMPTLLGTVVLIVSLVLPRVFRART